MEDLYDIIGAKSLTVAYKTAKRARPTETAMAVRGMKELGSRMVAFADAVGTEDDSPEEIDAKEFEAIFCDMDELNAAAMVAKIRAYLGI